jgi:cation diffusion facilitator CzcD-associated flavoprotein CzcO
MAIRLKKAGIDDFVILESAEDLGGTWRENRYPGAACDVPSPVYSFSFELSSKWSRMFAPQKEILAYLLHCAEKYDIRRHIRFRSLVTAADYDEAQGIWTTTIRDGQTIESRYLILCCGGLSRPSHPKIEGIKDFGGALFHTAQWPQDISLKGKRVAVIGTGASAIQIVPAIASEVAQLKVFQRTPAWILPKLDGPISQRQQGILEKIPLLGRLLRIALYWFLEIQVLAFLNPKLVKFGEKEALAYMKKEVKDPAVQAQLTPNYIMGCKRVLLSNDFYKTLNLEHVRLVTQGIQRMTPQGILSTDGQLHEVDVIICATGFLAAEGGAPFPIRGLGSRDLDQAWREGAEAYLGTTMTGFPNLFFIVGPNSGLGHNSIVFVIESQVNYILSGLKKVMKRKAKSFQVKPEVQAAFNSRLQQRFKHTVWETHRCSSWYRTKAGRNTSIWPGFSFEMRLRTLRFDLGSYLMERYQSEKVKK